MMNDSVLDMVALAEEIEGFILEVVPESEAVNKYGGTLYTLKPEEKEGQFCGVFIYKKHVQISFSKGATLKDPSGVLLGSGKLRRHVNFRSSNQIGHEALEELLRQASRQ